MRRMTVILAAIAMIGLGANAAMACDSDHASSGQASAAGAGMPAGCAGRSAGAGCCARGAGAACMSGAHTADMTSCPHANSWSNIEYRVSVRGQELRTFDRDQAFAAAATAGAPVTFHVMDTAYGTESEAQQALVTCLERHVQEMLTLQYVVNGQMIPCDQAAAKVASSGHCAVQYRVAAHDFARKADAEAYLAKLHAAVQAVKIVDSEGKPVNGCAAAHAAGCNRKLTYRVGDQVAADAVTADVLRAREQLRVILASQA